MSTETRKALERLLHQVDSNRRDFLKRLLVGGGTLAALVPLSKVVSAQDTQGEGKGKGKAKGTGKSTAKGKGKAKGKAAAGDGKAKGAEGDGKGKGKGQ